MADLRTNHPLATSTGGWGYWIIRVIGLGLSAFSPGLQHFRVIGSVALERQGSGALCWVTAETPSDGSNQKAARLLLRLLVLVDECSTAVENNAMKTLPATTSLAYRSWDVLVSELVRCFVCEVLLGFVVIVVMFVCE